jgi:SHS family lactate transporter-like MFS transporter
LSWVAIVGNVGAFVGGVVCGTLSERFGRKRAIIASALAAILVIPLWAGSHAVVLVALGGFLMQFMVQGAWGVMPVHLNELSPGAVRAVLPGFVYQVGNLMASRNGHFQAELAARFSGGRLGPVMGWTVVVVAVWVAIVTALGGEAKGADMSGRQAVEG